MEKNILINGLADTGMSIPFLIVGVILIIVLVINIILILTRSDSRKIIVDKEKNTSPNLSEITVPRKGTVVPAKPKNEDKSKNSQEATSVLNNPDMNEDTVILGVAAGLQKPGYLIRKSTGEEIPLVRETFVIGKDSHNVDYCIKDNPSVSRSHARVIRKGNHYYINDLQSTNFTYVNDCILTFDEETELHTGDVISLSNEKFLFRKG